MQSGEIIQRIRDVLTDVELLQDALSDLRESLGAIILDLQSETREDL